MATIEINKDNLVVHLHGWDVVLALRSTLTVPLASIRGAVATPPDAEYDEMKGLRIAGGYFPHSFATGYFWVTGMNSFAGQQHAIEKIEGALKDLSSVEDSEGFRVADVRAHLDAARGALHAQLRAAGVPERAKYLAFYDVHDPKKTIALDVEHGRLRRVVVQIDDETPAACVERIRAALQG